VARRLRFLRPPFKPYVRISRIRLTDGPLKKHACLQVIYVSCPPAERHSARAGRTAGETAVPLTLGYLAQAVSEFSHFVQGVIGSCDHALALTSVGRHDQSRVPSLNRLSPASQVLRTPRTPARHDSLSPSAYRNRQRPTWAAGTGLSCSAPNCVRMLSPILRERPAPLRIF
jgi:hypothetical protein